MKKSPASLLLILITFFAPMACDTASSVEDPTEKYFIRYFGVDGNQTAADMLVLPDGNIFLLGTSEFSNDRRIYLAKVDSKGQLLMQKTFDGTSDVAIDIEPAPGGNYAIVARYEKSSTDFDVRLLIVSSEGAEISNITYGSTQQKKEFPKSVTPLSDGGFIITGGTQADTTTTTTVNPDDFSNIFHFRCDENLVFDNTIWYEYYGNPEKYDEGIKAFEIAPDNILVFGYSNQVFTPSQVGKLCPIYYSIGSGGIVKGQPSIIGDVNSDISANYVLPINSQLGGGFLVAGTKTNSLGTITLQTARLKSPLAFNPSVDRQFDEEITVIPNSLNAIGAATSLSSPQGFLILGEELRTLGTKNISLTKIDQSAIVKWSVSLGSEEKTDRAAAVEELPDGKILVLGTVELADNQTKIALFKLNSTGQLHE